MSQHERVSGIRAALRRSRGLRRVSLTTVAVSVAATAGSLALGAGYAQSAPVAASVPAQQPAATSPTAPSGGAKQPSTSSNDDSNSQAPQQQKKLQPPAQPPTVAPAQPAPAAPPVTSGNS